MTNFPTLKYRNSISTTVSGWISSYSCDKSDRAATARQLMVCWDFCKKKTGELMGDTMRQLRAEFKQPHDLGLCADWQSKIHKAELRLVTHFSEVLAAEIAKTFGMSLEEAHTIMVSQFTGNVLPD